MPPWQALLPTSYRTNHLGFDYADDSWLCADDAGLDCADDFRFSCAGGARFSFGSGGIIGIISGIGNSMWSLPTFQLSTSLNRARSNPLRSVLREPIDSSSSPRPDRNTGVECDCFTRGLGRGDEGTFPGSGFGVWER